MRLLYETIRTQQLLGLVRENVENLDSTLKDFLSFGYSPKVFSPSQELIDDVKSTIEKSNLKFFGIVRFILHGAKGIALDGKVYLNKDLLDSSIGLRLYALFHEIAHQYQYKKYGVSKIYGIYRGNMSINDAKKYIKDLEITADEFATRKIQRLARKKLIPSQSATDAFPKYKDMPDYHIEAMIQYFIQMVKDNNAKTDDEISDLFYNSVIARI